MIIVEGPDGAGKTTLIRQLAQEFDLPIAPRVVSKQTNDLTDLQQWIDKNLQEGFQYRLFDRHRLISEFCYGPTLRPVQRPGFTDRMWVRRQLRLFYEEVQPMIIYCLPKLEVVKNNLEFDDNNDVVRDHIEQIYAAYLERSTLDELLLPGHVMVWDYTLDDILERSAYEDIPFETQETITSNILNPFRPMMQYAKGRAE
jgi:adenylate kinase family enzyme